MKSSSWGPLGAWGHLAGVRNLVLLPSDSLEQVPPLETMFFVWQMPLGSPAAHWALRWKPEYSRTQRLY